jgi:two-component system, OmpR family, sensor histidine kinase VicK
MQPRLSIRSKLLLSILLILLVSYSILVYTTFKSLSASLEEKIARDLETNLKYSQSQYLARAELMKYSMLQPASASPVHERMRTQDKTWLKAALRRWNKILPFIDFLTIVDPEKRVLARANSAFSGDRYQLTDIVDKAFREKQPVVSTELATHEFLCREGETNYCAEPTHGEALVVMVVIPIVANDGALLGAIITGDVINNDPHLPFKVQEIFGREVEVAVTQRGYRIASSLAEETPLPATIAPQILAKLEKGETYRGEAAIGERLYETAFEPIKNSRDEFVGSISVALSKEHVKKIRRDNLRNILASATVGIVLSFILAFIAARKLTGPLRALARGARMIENGDLSQRVTVNQEDEVGMLASSFNRMASALGERDRIIRDNTRELRVLNEQLEKKVEERTAELRMEMGRLEAILTSMAEGVVVTDAVDRVILCNPAAQKIFDLIPYRVLNQPIAEICDLGGFCALVEYIRQMRDEGSLAALREEEAEVKGKKLKINCAPLLDEVEGFAGAVMSIRDVTMEEEVDRMKTEFISTVSHELKTPLTSMKGSLQFILTKGKWLTDTERELISVCLRNTDRLIRLINDILDISKIEAGKVELSFKPHSVSEMLMYAIDEIKGFAMSRSVAIINNAGNDLPRVYCDHDRLIQVLTNLLSNAVKFSPEGKIVLVTAKREGNYVAVSVIDHGKTIQWSDRDKLFRKFQQIARSENMERGGTGLGLAICKEIIERHHGRIHYQEGVAGGNVFTFTVPVFEEQQ